VETRSVGIGRLVKGLLLTFVVGVAFVIASLPDGTALLARHDRWTWLAGPAEISAKLKAVLPPVTSLLQWINYALVAYAVALLLVSMRHARVGLVGWGIGVLVGSACLLHVLAWLGVIVFAVGGFIVDIFTAVMGFLVGIFSWLGEQLRDALVLPFVGLFKPFLGALAWAGALLALAAVLGGVYLFGAKWARTAAVVTAWVAVAVGVLTGLGWLFGLVPTQFWHSAGAVIGWIFMALVAWFVLATVGQLVLDQLTSSKHAGSGRLGVVMGAIAIGSTLAMLMLVGNIYDVYDLYPSTVAGWARETVLSDAPKFDSAMALVVISLCAIGVLRNLSQMRPEPDLLEFRRSLIYTVMGMITAGAISALDKATSD
jgi:hypothetical protein